MELLNSHYLICKARNQNVITISLPSWIGQETANRPFGLRVQLSPAYLSAAQDKGLTLSLLMVNVKQGSCQYRY